MRNRTERDLIQIQNQVINDLAGLIKETLPATASQVDSILLGLSNRITSTLYQEKVDLLSGNGPMRTLKVKLGISCLGSKDLLEHVPAERRLNESKLRSFINEHLSTQFTFHQEGGLFNPSVEGLQPPPPLIPGESVEQGFYRQRSGHQSAGLVMNTMVIGVNDVTSHNYVYLDFKNGAPRLDGDEGLYYQVYTWLPDEELWLCHQRLEVINEIVFKQSFFNILAQAGYAPPEPLPFETVKKLWQQWHDSTIVTSDALPINQYIPFSKNYTVTVNEREFLGICKRSSGPDFKVEWEFQLVGKRWSRVALDEGVWNGIGPVTQHALQAVLETKITESAKGIRPGWKHTCPL